MTQHIGHHGLAYPLFVGEPKPLSFELLLEHTVLFYKIIKDCLLLAVKSACQGDYKEVEGLMFAHSIENRPKGAPVGQTVTIDKVELNVDVPDSDFVMPEVEKPAEAEETEEEPGEGSE